jgi:hypothetical protein
MNATASINPTELPNSATGLNGKLFVLTILAGSFLLFLVQPMIARMALPRLGGAPAVWNSAMLVYQGLLLAGYSYAHWLARRPAKQQTMIHLILFTVAGLWLPLGLSNMTLPVNGSPIFWVPWFLLASIGPLFFVVSAQAPLMQRWYAMAGNTGNPYALYAASNLGSFGGLLAYPLVVEPLMPLHMQNWLWSGIYLLLFAMVAFSSRKIWATTDEAATQAATLDTRVAIPWKRRLYWIVLAAVPSGLMLSTTSYLTTDLVAMPLIWVIPLSVYLLSFSVAFADNQRLADIIKTLAAPIILTAGAMTFGMSGSSAAFAIGVSVGLLFAIAVALHGEMYRTRPPVEQLTSFYLTMSLGGVIGGFFCAIVAPLIFDWTWEHPLLIVAAAALLPNTHGLDRYVRDAIGEKSIGLIGLGLVAVAALFALFGKSTFGMTSNNLIVVLFILAMILGILVARMRIAFTIILASMMLVYGGMDSINTSRANGRMRSYFGTYSINNASDGSYRWINHGTTMHGLQMAKTPTLPVSYYGPNSGVGIAMRNSERLYGPKASIGVVGLGAGTLACYKQPGQAWQFFEIDPLVVEIARERGIFSFLSRCAPNAPIRVGDARLTMADVPAGSLDIIVLDAFSSDSIPLHLLTKEAFENYTHALRPEGMIVLHISNRYIDLEPIIAAEGKAGNWHVALRPDNPDAAQMASGMRTSKWLALSHDRSKLLALTGPLLKSKQTEYGITQWRELEAVDKVARWSDDYASVLPYLSVWKDLE